MNGTAEDAGFLQRLRALVGRESAYLGKRCRLVEILADEEILVLETRERTPPIQADQYGQAVYRANEVVQIPIFGPDRESLSEELMELLAALSDRSRELI